MHALARRREPVVGGADVPKDADLETGLLLDLAESGVLDLLAAIGRAFWKHPGAVGMSASEDDLARTVAVAKDDAACGDRIADAGRPAGTDRRHGADPPGT